MELFLLFRVSVEAFVFSVVEILIYYSGQNTSKTWYFSPYFNTESVSNLGIREYDLRCSEIFKRFSLDKLKNIANGKWENY